MIELVHELQSMHTAMQSAPVQFIKTAIIQATLPQKQLIADVLKSLPMTQRIRYLQQDTFTVFYELIQRFHECHQLLQQMDGYRCENLTSDPIVLDIPVRQYIHAKLDAIQQNPADLVHIKCQLTDDIQKMMQAPSFGPYSLKL